MRNCTNGTLGWGFVTHLNGGGGLGVRVQKDVGVCINEAGEHKGEVAEINIRGWDNIWLICTVMELNYKPCERIDFDRAVGEEGLSFRVEQ